MSTRIRLSITTSLLFCSLSTAQSDAVIANTRGTQFTTGIHLVEQDTVTCKTGINLSQNANGSVNLNGIYNGGSAWDPIRGGLWYSNGESLSCVDPATGTVICHSVQLPVIPRTKLSPFSITVSGLAFDNKENTLYLADGLNGDIYQIQLGTSTDPQACVYKSQFVGVKANMPAFHWLGGLAIDQVSRQLFVGSFHMTTGTRHIYVADLSNWGGKVKDVTGKAPLCPNGTSQALWLQGLAFDSGRSVLHVTDGTTTSAYTYDRTKAEVSPLRCCANPSTKVEDAFVGLAMVPQRATPTGNPCTLPPCPICSNVKLRTVGDAALGNPHFALRMTDAPPGGTVLGALGLGACTSGISLGFCAPVLVSPTSVLIVGVPLNSVASCGSTATLALPIPADASLFGAKASSQFLLQCKTAAGTGHVLTDCVTFEVTRN